MSETYKKIFIDGQTGEQRIEEFTPEEVAQKEVDQENAACFSAREGGWVASFSLKTKKNGTR